VSSQPADIASLSPPISQGLSQDTKAHLHGLGAASIVFMSL
jgi:hypothetical protein